MSFHNKGFAKFMDGATEVAPPDGLKGIIPPVGRKRPAPDRDGLIANHLRLVHKIAHQVYRSYSTAILIDDLVQIGRLALVEAAASYEDQGFGFTNYAKLRIRGSMVDELRRISGLSRAALKTRKLVRASEHQLSHELGRAPTEAEMAKKIGMSPSCYRSTVDHAIAVETVSSEETYSDDNIAFADQEKSVDDAMQEAELSAKLVEGISRLAERDAEVMRLYFMEEYKLADIAKIMAISPARVCQIKASALKVLRGYMDGAM